MLWRRLGIVSLVVAMSVAFWSAVPAGASPAPPGAFPMGGGLCGKRAKVYDKIKIWTVKAHDGRNVFLRCGQFPSDRVVIGVGGTSLQEAIPPNSAGIRASSCLRCSRPWPGPIQSPRQVGP